MARSVSYRHQVTDVINWNQIKANNETLFILRDIGPVGFVIQEEGNSKKFKVCLGDPHTCTCKDFRKEKDLCKHICWILLKRFKLDKEDPMSWQLGLVQREINDLIFGHRNRQPPKKVEKQAPQMAPAGDSEEGTSQRAIGPEDVCPICQEDLLNSQKAVTYCRGGCGNNIHIRCMSVWTEHKRKELDLKLQDSVPCPVCRGDFVSVYTLMQEVTNSNHDNRHAGVGPYRKRSSAAAVVVRHHGYFCSDCSVQPVEGKLYRCTECTPHLHLCSRCFGDAAVHSEHSFQFREHQNGRWEKAPSTRGLPEGLINGMQNNDLENFDYSLLQQLDKKPGEGGSGLSKRQIQKHLPTWALTGSTKLVTEPGHQCRMCLMRFRQREEVRKLPRCKHVFHSACIDPWLLHRSPLCPLDDKPVIAVSAVHAPLTASTRPPLSATPLLLRQLPSGIAHDSELSSALMIASIGNRPRSTTMPQQHHLGSMLHQHPAVRKFRQLPPLSQTSTIAASDSSVGAARIISRGRADLGFAITPIRLPGNQRMS